MTIRYLILGLLLALTTTAPATADAFVATVHRVTADDLGASWRDGCPVPPEDLRLVTLTHVGLDGRTHRGQLVVATGVTPDVVNIFRTLYRERYPIERMRTVDHYDADDDLSMADNNTSAFNCRPITGGTAWSNHSYGRAIDLNPQLNPYISASGEVLPPNGAPYADRTRTDPGLIHAGDPTVRAFARHGWDWGGYWTSPIDYQHFEREIR
ncbi:peptidase M15 [Actinophytocola xinjiangensis]|uniref:Peptidase M15 n=1 Tax=Actinophytocola xinjiangensis TaxID=485602 RepID=A0A7Z1ATR8_9PSEU|nr:M15 family metallopeptidase [Actinophytocola xinjiangensis]OLF05130.1 peptidase M15 [Actinophytocola xinjiangensis]